MESAEPLTLLPPHLPRHPAFVSHLQGKLDDAIKALTNRPERRKLMVMLRRLAEVISFETIDQVGLEVRIDRLMGDDETLIGEIEHWCSEQLQEAISAGPFIASEIKAPLICFVDTFACQETWEELLKLYLGVQTGTLLNEAYYLSFIRRFPGKLLRQLVKQKLAQIVFKRPGSANVIEVVIDLNGQILASNSVIDLILQLEDGRLTTVKELAAMYEQWVTLQYHDKFRAAVLELQAERQPPRTPPVQARSTDNSRLLTSRARR